MDRENSKRPAIIPPSAKRREKAVSVSIGIPAHNEQSTIGPQLRRVLSLTAPPGFRVVEVVLVASGCTDRTVEIAHRFQSNHPRLRVIDETERRGLANALNALFEQKLGDILVVANADTIIPDDLLTRLLPPLRDPNVGAVVGIAWPINRADTFWGYVARLFYSLNYQPEFLRVDFEGCCALRHSALNPIPECFVDNETWVDRAVRVKGYRIVAAENCYTFTKAPETIREFVAQRRRYIYCHLETAHQLSYVSHLDMRLVIPKAVRRLRWTFRAVVWNAGALLLIALSSAIGWYDYRKRRSHLTWKMVASTKSLF